MESDAEKRQHQKNYFSERGAPNFVGPKFFGRTKQSIDTPKSGPDCRTSSCMPSCSLRACRPIGVGF